MSLESPSRRSKPTIVVTGAAGLVGTALREALFLDYDLICLDLQPAPSLYAGELWYQLDVTDIRAVDQLFCSLQRPLSGLVHLAWYYDFSNLPHPRYQAAVDSLPGLVASFGQHATPEAPFVFASSMAAMASTVPGIKQTPESPSSEGWQYPASKVRGERSLRTVSISQPIVELVLAGVYSDFCELVPLFQSIERIRRGSIQSWFFPGRTDRGLTYVHVADVARAFQCALKASYPKTRSPYRLLVGEGTPVTNQEIFDASCAAFRRKKLPILTVPPIFAKFGAHVIGLFSRENFVQPWMISFAEEHFEFDVSRTAEVIGWAPTRHLKDTIPILVSLASSDPDEWLLRNRRRPWRRYPV